MQFLDLFVVALIPVVKTLLICGVGLVLALERLDILGETARHNLNNLLYCVFSPAFVASNLADTVTTSSLIELWFVPVNILLTFVIGSALGWMLIRITNPPRHLHGLVISCCAAGNLGALPLIIVPAICEDTGSPFGDSSTCSRNGLAYTSLSMAIGLVFIWVYVYSTISAYITPAVDSTISTSKTSKGSEILPESSIEEAFISNDRLRDFHNASDEAYDKLLPPIHDGENEKVPFQEKIKLQLTTLVSKMNLKALLGPVNIAAVIGLLIGAISPLRKLLVGDDAALHVINSSASMLGDASIPSMTLLLGANLLKGLRKPEVGLWIIVGVQVVRFIAMPVFGILVVKGANYIGLVGSDPLYQFVLLQQYVMPCALYIGIISQLFGVGESECSVILLWNYGVASVALTLWSTYHLWLVS